MSYIIITWRRRVSDVKCQLVIRRKRKTDGGEGEGEGDEEGGKGLREKEHKGESEVKMFVPEGRIKSTWVYTSA